VTKIALLPLLFVLGFSTPSFAQPCIADTIAAVSNDDESTTYVLASEAIYRRLPPPPANFNDRYGTISDLEPWIGSGHPVWTCGDHVLLLVTNLAKECHVGVECQEEFKYYLIPVACLRRCFATKNQ
jgi:hypothetical protein